MASNPMQQFTVHKIGPEIKIAGIDLSFTNASLLMIISARLASTLYSGAGPDEFMRMAMAPAVSSSFSSRVAMTTVFQ